MRYGGPVFTAENFNRGEMRFGTQVTRALLDRLSCPDKKLKIIHVAGSNGKGSVCEYMTRILIAAGKRTGTFTSPAVYDYCEQFTVDGVPLTHDKVNGYIDKVLSASDGLSPTAFETETAAAFYAFYIEGCEYAVIECGLGGLTDATNAAENKLVAIINSVSLEHTAYLGDTVEKICAQKAGIIRGCPAVVNSLQTEAAEKYFRSVGAEIAEAPRETVYGDNTAFSVGGERYVTKMLGHAQPYNAAAAIAAAHAIGIDGKAIKKGISEADLRGRIEVIISGGVKYVLDGAHNPAAFAPVCGFLKNENPENVTAVYGCLSDKDIDGCLKRLSATAENVICVRCPSPRALSADDVYAACAKYFKRVIKADGIAAALDKAKTGTVAVCGSFTLLKEARSWIEKRL